VGERPATEWRSHFSSRGGSTLVEVPGAAHHSTIIMHMHGETRAPLCTRASWVVSGTCAYLTTVSFFSIRPLPRPQSYLPPSSTHILEVPPAIEEAAAASSSPKHTPLSPASTLILFFRSLETKPDYYTHTTSLSAHLLYLQGQPALLLVH
jgi:hypothetical protein